MDTEIPVWILFCKFKNFQTSSDKINSEPCIQLLKKNESGEIEKSQQVYLSEKEGEGISAIRNTFIHIAENIGLVPVLESYSDKDSKMEQELANCLAVYDVATYKKRRVCVKIKKYSVNKPPYIQIRLFTAKENKASCLCQICLERFQRTCPSLGKLKVC